MKFKFLLAATIAALLALASCKKDDTATPDSPANTPPPSKKLKKVTMTEDGITTIYNLAYDGANRLLSYKTADNAEYVLFSYDAQGNLTGIEEKEEEFKNIYTYSYENNAPATGVFKSWRVIAGQADELIEDDRLTYTVNSNKVTGISLEMLQAGAQVDLQLTYTGGNLTKVISTGAVPYTADFSFGTQHSAFPKVSNYVLDQAGFSLQFACNNEMLSARYDFPGTTSDVDIHTQYTYDNAGYVLTGNDGDTQMIFEYQ
jgi:YD repeat-containing protein